MAVFHAFITTHDFSKLRTVNQVWAAIH